MNPPSHDPAPPTSEPAQRPQWRRGFNGYALTIAVLVHLLLLIAVLSWRSRVPPPEKPRNMDVRIIQSKPSMKAPEPPLPPPKMPDLAPPVIPELPVIEMHKVEPVPPPPPPLPPPPPSPPPPPPPAPTPAPVAVAASSPAPPKLFEECEGSPDRKMIAEVFRLRPSVNSVTEIRRLKPVKTVCLAQLDVTPRKFTDGFPGLDMSEWFALDIRFTVNVPEDGRWELMLLSDDGAILTVDDVEVINNDGIHAPKPVIANVRLEKGLRNFRVRYFQGPAPDLALMLGWKKPREADFQYIPRRLLGRPAAAAAPG
jgi:hypothetical protein